MTPEQIAEKILKLVDWEVGLGERQADELRPGIAAAIREAVAAERERCVRIEQAARLMRRWLEQSGGWSEAIEDQIDPLMK